MPATLSADIVAAATRDLIHTIQHPTPVALLLKLGNKQQNALLRNCIHFRTAAPAPYTQTEHTQQPKYPAPPARVPILSPTPALSARQQQKPTSSPTEALRVTPTAAPSALRVDLPESPRVVPPAPPRVDAAATPADGPPQLWSRGCPLPERHPDWRPAPRVTAAPHHKDNQYNGLHRNNPDTNHHYITRYQKHQRQLDNQISSAW